MREAIERVKSTLNGERTLARARGIEPHAMESIYAIAIELLEAGHLERARTSFEMLCLYDHENSTYWRALGAVRAAQKSYDGAAAAYAFAADTLPTRDEELEAAMSQCLAAGGENEAAIALGKRLEADTGARKAGHATMPNAPKNA